MQIRWRSQTAATDNYRYAYFRHTFRQTEKRQPKAAPLYISKIKSRPVGIRRHPPVSARRNADRADLGRIGDAAALELADKEPAQEGGEPFRHRRAVVLARKGALG